MLGEFLKLLAWSRLSRYSTDLMESEVVSTANYTADQSVCVLPSVYQPDPIIGLMHLPRFLAKVRLHQAKRLPQSYQRNFTEGLDALLCLHIGLEPSELMELAAEYPDDNDVYYQLTLIFHGGIDAASWNRQLSQLGLRGAYKEQLDALKEQVGIADRADIATFADLVEYQEYRL